MIAAHSRFAAPQIAAELKLSTVEMGILFSAFFRSYASFQILGGWLVDHYSKVGPALSILVGGLFVGHFGWRALFVSTRVVSLLWLLPWLAWTNRNEMSASAAIEKGPS